MQDCPKIVVATPTWSLNGPNIFSANLVRGLRASGIPAHIVLTRPDWRDPKPLPKPLDIPFETLPLGFQSFRSRCDVMIRYLERQSPCIYIPNHDFSHSCISSQLPDQVKIIGIVHSDDPQHYEHVNRLGRYWNAVVSVSSAIASETLKTTPSLAQRHSVIPYGVNAAAELPARSSERERPLRVIYAGVLNQIQKRVLDLPRILKAVVDLKVPIKLSIAGAGPTEIRLKEEFAASGGGQVEFLGILENEALSKVLARQDVFLLVSAFEGLPIVVVEAMGQGCIPVVSDIRSGIPELVEEGVSGFRVPMGDISGFAACLAALYRSPAKRRQMSAAAYAKASNGCYRMDQMVQSYVDLFGTVVEEAKRGAFRRPKDRIQPPPRLPWPERLPGSVQYWGHHVKRVLAKGGV